MEIENIFAGFQKVHKLNQHLHSIISVAKEIVSSEWGPNAKRIQTMLYWDERPFQTLIVWFQFRAPSRSSVIHPLPMLAAACYWSRWRPDSVTSLVFLEIISFLFYFLIAVLSYLVRFWKLYRNLFFREIVDFVCVWMQCLRHSRAIDMRFCLV